MGIRALPLILLALCVNFQPVVCGGKQYDGMMIEGFDKWAMTVRDPCGTLVEDTILTQCSGMSKIALFDVRTMNTLLRSCDSTCTSPSLHEVRNVDYSVHSQEDTDIFRYANLIVDTLETIFSVAGMILLLGLSHKDNKKAELDEDASEYGYLSFADLDDQAFRMENWRDAYKRNYNNVRQCVEKKAKNKGFPDKGEWKADSGMAAMRKLAGQGNADYPFFVDAKGNTCYSWRGYRCDRAEERWNYASEEEDAIKANCPVSCAMNTFAESQVVVDADEIKRFVIEPHYFQTRSRSIVSEDLVSEDLDAKNELLNMAKQMNACSDDVHQLVQTALNSRPWLARDDAVKARTTVLSNLGIGKGYHSAVTQRHQRSWVHYVIITGIWMTFVCKQMLQLVDLYSFHAMLPVLVWCENKEGEVNQTMTHCLKRSDQSDGLGMLGLQCEGCASVSIDTFKNKNECPFDCYSSKKPTIKDGWENKLGWSSFKFWKIVLGSEHYFSPKLDGYMSENAMQPIKSIEYVSQSWTKVTEKVTQIDVQPNEDMHSTT